MLACNAALIIFCFKALRVVDIFSTDRSPCVDNIHRALFISLALIVAL